MICGAGAEGIDLARRHAPDLILLDDPTTCPHGNPIPGSDYVEPDSKPLSDQPVGQQFTVRRIPEELEFTPGLLEFLEESSLRPGCTGVITASSPDGTMECRQRLDSYSYGAC